MKAQKKIELRSYQNPPRARRQYSSNKPSRTDRTGTKTCDINYIMSKYQKTGIIEHVNQHAPNYGFATSQTLKEALDQTMQSEQIFNDLPSSERAHFNNNPVEFFEFVQNPEKAQEAAARGYNIKTDTSVSNKPAKGSEQRTETAAGTTSEGE